jgi:RNA polymerase sigma-70 factor (ECF subfamily)
LALRADGRVRSADRQSALAQKLSTESLLVTADTFDVLDEFDAVAAAWSRLSERDHEVIALVTWDGLVPAQAAVVLGVSWIAIRPRFSRAKRRLRSQLELPENANDQAPPVFSRLDHGTHLSTEKEWTT